MTTFTPGVLRVCGKGIKVVLVPLPLAAGRAIDRAIGSRIRGPLLLNNRDARMDRHAATRRRYDQRNVRCIERCIIRGVDQNKAVSALGFAWDSSTVPDLPAHATRRALWRFSRMLPEYVWDAAVLEGNPFTYPEVQTLLEGVTVGGRRLSDERQILSLSESATSLHDLVESSQFALSKETSDNLNSLIARYEALEAGHFRGEGRELANVSVSLGEYGTHRPPPTEPGGENLRRIYDQGTAFIAGAVPGVFEQAGAYFLFGAFMQFYFDGNKRTARYMMNGWLMSHGIDAISIPAARKQEFNEEMIDFYRSKDGTGMLGFLASCHAEAQA